MKRAIIRCILLYPVALAAQLSAFPLVPLAVAFCNEAGRLPGIFWWLETSDHLGWEGPMQLPHTREIMRTKGNRAGLRRWLWRNRAYALQFRMGAPKDKEWVVTRPRGAVRPPKWGFSWFWGTMQTPHDGRWYFELQPRLSIGRLVLYIRIGWKVCGVFGGGKGGSAGMYTGFTPRSETLGVPQ